MATTLNGYRLCSKSINCINILPANIVYLTYNFVQKFCRHNSEVYHQNIRKLEELLNLKPALAKGIVDKSKKLSNFDSAELADNYHTCKKAGISKKTLIENPDILADLNIMPKLAILNTFKYDTNVVAPLLLLNIKTLDRIEFQDQIKEKITNVPKLLDVTEAETCKILTNRQFLIHLNLNHLKTSIKLLTDYGIPKEEILKDLWVLKYNVHTIENRLKIAKDNSIYPIKTWMVRAQHLIFENHIRRQSDNKLILGDNSLTEYLSERLECSQAIARYIITKHTALQNKSLKKMNVIIDFLLNYGYTRIQICRTPKILLHSIDTIKKRLKEVESQGTKLDTLSVLTKSKKQFDQFLESLKPTKMNKIKRSSTSIC